MLNQKKLEDHLISMEAAAKVMLATAKNIRLMIDLPERPRKKDTTEINFYRRKERSLLRNQNKTLIK